MKPIYISLLLLLALTSCEHDFIEDDLAGISLTILAPADDDTVTTTTPLFWWNEISGARTYRLQVVYPDFMAPQQLLYDTALEGDRFIPSLGAGDTYYWRIRPENGSSEGEWITRRITIDSSVSLANQSVVVTQPATNGSSTSSGTVTFAWNAVSAATFYRVEIVNLSSGATVDAANLSVNAFSSTLVQGTYEFKVRAENTSSFTPWSTRSFTVDQTAPAAPVLQTPSDNFFYSSVPATITFDWSSAGDAVTDSLYIAADSTFTSGLIVQTAVAAAMSTYTWSGANAATTYFWRVRSVDAAANRSVYSSVFRLVIN